MQTYMYDTYSLDDEDDDEARIRLWILTSLREVEWVALVRFLFGV